ncbi:roadblock/LC7 domain-containing protein [Mariprofundus erugo]|uniref:Roadblock/LC7 domain-containing protein n=1 Tax=Mariprofundus erugo TaxID=2528639 RepID=A0A5R9GWQ9_9PROT|nr:roadblock/LC7 domain-containing protein [Mariprofundus erugo]TLS67534.1 roadblock/LC7 domain-containing protein [Mariprofundus erugo]TLS76199.1 roadblock/LC7 domain-containing protein [Mariprofundus erugo]
MDKYIKACHDELGQLVAREAHLNAALLCSVDGLPVAYAASIDIEADAIAAMCSSMLSLGDALAIQGGDDEDCIQVVTQSRGHTVALIHAGPDMLLALMGSRELKLGMLLGHARKEVEIIVDLINKSKQEKKMSEQAKPAAEKKPALLEELVKRVMQEAQNR